jgi:tetratricopeptide (TPR) repeat protein
MRFLPLRPHAQVWLLATAAVLASVNARAELIDNISVTRVGDNAEIEVRFSLRVQYLRHFPKSEGDTLRVNVSLVPINGIMPLVEREIRRSPKNNLLPPFTVTYPDQSGAVLIQFAEAVKFRVGPGSDTRSIRIRVALPPQKRVPEKGEPGADKPAAGIALGRPSQIAPVPPTQIPAGETTPASDVDATAQTLMMRARAAIDIEDYPTAVDTLNRLLNLPPNRFSKEAQELAGVARQLNGEMAKARAEYELYLKLYPEGEGSIRVRGRLAGLAAPSEEERKEVAVSEPSRVEKMLYGSLSQYYYSGATKIDTVDRGTSLPNEQQLSFTDERTLISSIDLTGRVRRSTSDTRVVVRDTYSADFLANGEDVNRLYAAYLEHEQKNWGLLLRGGRQSPPTGGLVERFDGGYIRKSLGRWFRVLALAGEPAVYDIDSERFFYQGGLEVGRESSPWGLTLYAFEQTIDGITDRRTVGGEARYFSNGSSVYTLVDYDILFQELNILLAQGNWQNSHRTNVNVIVDRRKTPTLQTANAVLGETATSIQELLDSGLTEEMLRENAAAVTAESTLYLLGLTQTLNSSWQVGGDVRASRVSSTDGNGALPPAPDTGWTYIYTLQATATAIFSRADVNVLSVGFIEAPTYTGPLVLLSNSTQWRNWRLEPALRYFGQDDETGGKLTRANAALRLSYRVRDSISLEAEAGYEVTKTSGFFAEDETRREFFSLGYRWDFN